MTEPLSLFRLVEARLELRSIPSSLTTDFADIATASAAWMMKNSMILPAYGQMISSLMWSELHGNLFSFFGHPFSQDLVLRIHEETGAEIWHGGYMQACCFYHHAPRCYELIVQWLDIEIARVASAMDKRTREYKTWMRILHDGLAAAKDIRKGKL